MTYIKSIELENFKSFAGRTKFDFIKGFNIIAGANGSGKSNIVDALLFVFGESSKKEMRSELLSDLIFNGGKHLKEAEFAKATVTLDNSNNEFKGYEEKEISISRKIDRSGKSVFRINGKASTREEIVNLLSQIKMNSNNFNIVPQGKILSIATVPPEEKLSIIKSLAGIDVFEEKRDKAMSELKKVEENISTIQTVQNEKKKLLDELESEKKKADEYKQLSEKVRILSVKSLLLKKKKLSDNYDSIQKELSSLQEEKERIKKEMDDGTQRLLRLREEIQRINEEAGSAGEAKILEKEREAANARAELERTELLIKTDREQLERIQETLSSLEESEAEAKRILDQEREEIAKVDARMNELLVKKKEISEKLNEIRRIAEEKKQNEEKLNQINKKIYEDKLLLVDFPKALELQDRLSDIRRRIDEYTENKNKLTVEFTEMKPLVDRARSEVEREEQLVLILKERTEREKEELNSHNRSFSVVEKLKSNIGGILGTVETLFRVKSDQHVVAVFNAIGRRREFIVVDTVDSANKAIQFLKEMKLGAFTFIPLDQIQHQGVLEKPKEEGIVDFLINLVDFDPSVEPAMRFVFSDTLLVDNFENARKLIHNFRMVTLDGTVFEKAGTIYGGYAHEYSGTELINRYTQDQEELNNHLQVLNSLKAEASDGEARLSSLMMSIKALDQQLLDLNNERKRLEAEASKFSGSESEITHRIDELEREKKLIEEALSKFSKESDGSLEKELEEINKETTELEVRAANSRSRMENIMKFDLNNILRRKQDLLKEKTRFEEEISEQEKKIGEIKEKLKTIESSLREKSAALEEMRRRRDELEKEISKGDKQKEEMAASVEKINEKIDAVTVKQAEAKAKLDVVLEELAKYDTSGIEAGEESLEAVQRQLSENQNKLNSFGPVNELALNRYNEVLEEFNNYNSQLLKLEEEKTKILSVIKEIDDNKLSVIKSTLGSLNQVFDYVFHSISNGNARLDFENQDDPLNSGIEIHVDLPNKKVHTIHGLSGGELSIVSISLIIAISKYVNAQFYVLDEVDAALDQSNSERFSSLIKTYSADTQFIVISHNETTLINADRAYGVMMDENGISKVVSINISEKSKKS